MVLSLGCKAESVGVEIRRGGPDAISMEDIRRDVLLLEAQQQGRASGMKRPEAGWQGLTDRLQQMKTVPAFGQSYRAAAPAVVICSQKRGTGSGVVLLAVEDDPAEPGGSTAALAMLISLAKAWDTRLPPARTILFCAWEGSAGFEALVAAPPVPWGTVQTALLLGETERTVPEVAFDTTALGFLGPVLGLDFQAVQQRTLEVDEDLRRRVTAAP